MQIDLPEQAVKLGLICILCVTACTVELNDQFDFVPIYSTIPVNVGVSITGPFQNVKFSHPLVKDIYVGEVSSNLFLQVFNTMFETTKGLSSWPSSKNNDDLKELDGIIELDTCEFNLSVGNDGQNPSKFSILYKVCLYSPDGKVIDCWSTQSKKLHQRKPFEFDLGPSSLQPIIEDAMRAAIADFMIAFQNSKSVNSWVNNKQNSRPL